MEHYFIFKGIHSRDLGVKCGPAPIVSPERIMSALSVAGRDGYILLDSGSYAPVYKTLDCRVYSKSNLATLTEWLSGTGTLVFSTEPELFCNAYVSKGISIGYILEDYRAFKVTFVCQPFKYNVNRDSDIIQSIKSPLSFYGKGNINAAPLINIWGSGLITLTVNGEQITINNVSGQVRLDSDLMNVYDPVSLVNKSMDMRGNFPVLVGGEALNTINFANASKIEIIPNWRYI